MIPVQVIGAGLCFEDLTGRHLKIIGEAEVLVGGRRHLAWFPDFIGLKRQIAAPLSEVVSDIGKWAETRKVAVAASGDPLFFGIGLTLVKALGAQNVVIHPNVSTLAACFARIGSSWRDAATVSLHGTDRAGELLSAMAGTRPVFVLTDPDRGPAWIGKLLNESGNGDWEMWVFEQLGAESEKVRRVDPEKAADMVFSEPNAVVLKRVEPIDGVRAPVLGAPDDWYAHERGMITKAEIRAVALSKLRLGPDHVFWDLGAGSGSVSVEASLFLRRGKIMAVEKNASRAGQIRANAEKFGVRNIRVIQANLPECMESLERPHRIFIGGGGKDLPLILDVACRKLLPGGRIVLNTVLVESMAAGMEKLKELGFRVEAVQAQVNESAELPSGTRFAAKNPVWIVSAERL